MEPRHKSQDPSLWIQRFNPQSGESLRLICFPFAGGDAVAFRDWVKYLGPDVEVVGIRLPGRGSRIGEAPVRRLRDMIAPMTDEILPLLDWPVVFFGHSLGATLAYEVTQELLRRSENLPKKIIVSACEPPQNSFLPREQMHLWEEERFLAKIKSMGGVPQEVLAFPELLKFLVPIVQADVEALETYRYQTERRIPCPITGIFGEEDPMVPEPAILGWGERTHQYKIKKFPGGHFYFLDRLDEFFEFLKQELQLK